MKLDVFNHILPKDLYEEFCRIAPNNMALNAFKTLPELWDLDAHLALMDGFGDYQQILSLSNPPIEMLGGPNATPALARFANDGLAALVKRHPDRFPGFIASLPMNNPDAAVREANRAITELRAGGIQIYTNVLGKPLSAPEYFPLFQTMAEHDLPVWIHPMRGPSFPDYATEDASENEIWFTFGWPYETSACVTRLIFAGIFDKLPTLKIITHHMGGMIPYFAEKIALGFRQIFDGEMGRNPAAAQAGLKRQPIEYFRLLYGDTALNGSMAATRCGHAFFTTERSLFATDAPFDSEGGRALIAGTIAAINSLEISDSERQRIFAGNAKALLRLV
jgi:predicted TIM-barrel fold metal-dependent hydrolase